jgi:hypothetical protein
MLDWKRRVDRLFDEAPQRGLSSKVNSRGERLNMTKSVHVPLYVLALFPVSETSSTNNRLIGHGIELPGTNKIHIMYVSALVRL